MSSSRSWACRTSWKKVQTLNLHVCSRRTRSCATLWTRPPVRLRASECVFISNAVGRRELLHSFFIFYFFTPCSQTKCGAGQAATGIRKTDQRAGREDGESARRRARQEGAGGQAVRRREAALPAAGGPGLRERHVLAMECRQNGSLFPPILWSSSSYVKYNYSRAQNCNKAV